MPVNQWRQEAEESKKETVFQESFDELLENIMEPIVVPVYGNEDTLLHDREWLLKRYIPVKSQDGRKLTFHRKNVSVADFIDLEKTYRAIKDDCSPDDLEYVLNETDDYYSDRFVHLKNRVYSENGHQYPPLKRIDTKRSRNARRS